MVQWNLAVDQLVRQPPGSTTTDADFISANNDLALEVTLTCTGSLSIEGAMKLQESQSPMLASSAWILNLGRKCTYWGRL